MGDHVPYVLDLVPPDELRVHHVLEQVDRAGKNLIVDIILNDFVEYLILDQIIIELLLFEFILVRSERFYQFE